MQIFKALPLYGAAVFGLAAILTVASPATAQDADGDGLPDSLEIIFGDTDGDGIPNVNDPDDDNDGVLTIDEVAAGDTDGDRTPDYLDIDDDSDGIYTDDELSFGGGDFDGDGIPNHRDTDDDNDGVLTQYEDASGFPGSTDTDGDRVIDAFDTDDDGDGLLTLDEHGGQPVADTSGNGRPDNPIDLDDDGRPDYLDPNEPGLTELSQGHLETTTGGGGRTWFPQWENSDQESDIGTVDGLSVETETSYVDEAFNPFFASTSGLSTVGFPSEDEFILTHDLDFEAQFFLPHLPNNECFSCREEVHADSKFTMALELPGETLFDIDMSLATNMIDPFTSLDFILDDVTLLSIVNSPGSPMTASLNNFLLGPGIHIVMVELWSFQSVSEFASYFIDAEISFLQSQSSSGVPTPGPISLVGLGLVCLGLRRFQRRNIP